MIDHKIEKTTIQGEGQQNGEAKGIQGYPLGRNFFADHVT
jgi:hypothetical protein